MDELKKFISEQNAIIDFVIPPGMLLESKILDLIDDSKEVFIIDTQGQINHHIRTSENRKNKKTLDGHYIFASSLDDICRFMYNLKPYKNFLLFFDSITFVCDISPENIKVFINMLWNIVYTHNATVITINHFRVGTKQNGGFGLVPRMGNLWKKTVSFQIELFIEYGKLNYRIHRNVLLNM